MIQIDSKRKERASIILSKTKLFKYVRVYIYWKLCIGTNTQSLGSHWIPQNQLLCASIYLCIYLGRRKDRPVLYPLRPQYNICTYIVAWKRQLCGKDVYKNVMKIISTREWKRCTGQNLRFVEILITRNYKPFFESKPRLDYCLRFISAFMMCHKWLIVVTI